MLCGRKKTAIMPALHPLSLLSFETSDKYTLFQLECEQTAFPLFSAPLPYSKSHIENPHITPSLFSLVHQIPQCFDANWFQVVFHGCTRYIFKAKAYLHHEEASKAQITEFEIKPSDALLLSLTEKLDLYCTDSLLQRLKVSYAGLNN